MNLQSPPYLLRPCWMEIDLDQLERNIREIRRVIGSDRKLVAVAKADAYGYGIQNLAPTMFNAGVDIIALGNLNDAIKLRETGNQGPLLLFGSYIPEEVANIVVEYQLIPTVWDIEGAVCFSKAAHRPLEVFLKIDTGLTRVGVLPNQAVEVARQISGLPNISLRYIYTHFADPLNPDFTLVQFNRFSEVLKSIKAAGINIPYACVASSAVVSLYPDMYINAVDPGRLMYGFYYPPSPPVPINVVPIVRAVKSRVIQTKWIEAGQSIGYARAFTTLRRTLIGVLSIGWSDGFLRGNTTESRVLVRGEYCPIIGRINLEHCIVDLTGVDGSQAGDEVVIIGHQGDETITLSDHAKWAGMSEMEVIIYLGRSLPRVYYKEGSTVQAIPTDTSGLGGYQHDMSTS